MSEPAQAFLSAFAEAATAPPPASRSVTPPQKQPRKLRPVQLQLQQTDSQSTHTAFAGAETEPAPSSPFLRKLPKSEPGVTKKEDGNNAVKTLPRKRDAQCQTATDVPAVKQKPARTRRRPRRFVPLTRFEASEKVAEAQKQSSIAAKQEGLSDPSLTKDAPKPPLCVRNVIELRDNIAVHVSHLRTMSTSPTLFFPAVKALLSCLHSSTKGEPITLWSGCEPADAAAYCRSVLEETLPLFADYPAPVIKTFREVFPDTEPCAPEATFPAAFGVWTPTLSGATGSLHAFDAEPESVSRRLRGNFETTWDQIVRLQRLYRGDVSSCPPGTLPVSEALQAMAMLHPANMDVFAARLIKLVSASGLQSHDTPLKLRQLGERMRDAPQGKYSKKGPGVVLHRLPELVRSMFEDDPAQLFFLDFLTGVDSARLNTALVPRLVAEVAKKLEAAASATTNVGFTNAVLDARVYAKLLAVTMHASNWAHSKFSLSGIEDNHVSPGLGRQALRRRVPIHSAFFNAAIDVHALIRGAVTSGHVLPVLASVAVADVVLRLAAVDPVAKASTWYRRGVEAMRAVRVVSVDGGVRMPLLHAVVSALLDSEACAEEGPEEMVDKCFVLRSERSEWPGVGDTRLLRVVCPMLDELRKSVHMREGGKTTARRITPRVAGTAQSSLIRSGEPVEREDDTGDGDVQAALRKEFYARMDGRLREVVRIVASARPENGTARETFLKIVGMLYPGTSNTVATVAANLCEYEVGLMERELTKAQRNKEAGKRKPRVDKAVETAENGIQAMEV